MARIIPNSHIASISGKYSHTDEIYTRTSAFGRVYGVRMSHPNMLENPTPAQQKAQSAFADTWRRVNSILTIPTLDPDNGITAETIAQAVATRTHYENLWRTHTAACRHHRSIAPQYQDITTAERELLNGRRTPYTSLRTFVFHLIYNK